MFFPDVRTDSQVSIGSDQFKNRMKEEGGATTGEIIDAGFGVGRGESLGGKLDQMADLSIASKNNSELMTADEANALLPDIDTPYTEPVSEGEVNYQREKLDIANNRNEILDKAGNGFFKGSVLPFTSKLAGAALDPLDLAIGAFTGWGAGKAIGTIGTRTSSVVLSKLASSPFGKNVAEAFAGNLVAEVGVSLASKVTRDDYTLQQAVLNATVGTAMMTSIFAGGGKLLKTMGKLNNKTRDAVYKMSDDALNAGKSPAKIQEAYSAKIVEMDEVTPEFSSIVRKHFPDKADEILEEGSISAMKSLRKEEGFDIMTKEMEDMGEIRSKFKDDEYNASDFFTPAESAKLMDEVKAHTSDLEYDSKIEVLEGQVPENYGDNFYTKEIADNNIGMETKLNENIDSLSETSKTDYNTHIKETEQETTLLQGLKEFGECVFNLGSSTVG